MRESVFRRVFKGMGKGFRGEHITPRPGQGGESQPETRPYAFGDDVADLDFRASFGNSLRRLAGAGEGEADADWASLAPDRVGE